MNSASRKIKDLGGGRLAFLCPGCGERHTVLTADGFPKWSYNGKPDAPTLTPEIHLRSRPSAGSPFKAFDCRSVVTDGNIEFHRDCSHELAGQVVELPVYREEIS